MSLKELQQLRAQFEAGETVFVEKRRYAGRQTMHRGTIIKKEAKVALVRVETASKTYKDQFPYKQLRKVPSEFPIPEREPKEERVKRVSSTTLRAVPQAFAKVRELQAPETKAPTEPVRQLTEMTLPERIAAVMGSNTMSAPEIEAALDAAGQRLVSQDPRRYIQSVMSAAMTPAFDDKGQAILDEWGDQTKTRLFEVVQRGRYRVVPTNGAAEALISEPCTSVPACSEPEIEVPEIEVPLSEIAIETVALVETIETAATIILPPRAKLDPQVQAWVEITAETFACLRTKVQELRQESQLYAEEAQRLADLSDAKLEEAMALERQVTGLEIFAKMATADNAEEVVSLLRQMVAKVA